MTTDRKAGHTKGPYETDGVGIYAPSQNEALESILIASVVDDPNLNPGEREANASLFGTAPDLLAALEQIASSDTTIDRCAIARRILIKNGLASWLTAQPKP